MAEIKNSFLGAKMNKDIDDRLLSPNEYRDAVNLQVSRAENSDVGSLQTVYGNELLVDFNELENLENLECIGYFSDITNNRVFLFLTDYEGVEYSATAHNFIYVYSAGSPVSSINPQKLVEGPFLNFSKLSPIIGVNLLEGLLFWTDDRNQPRKINVDRPLGYYTAEEHISVATFAPYQAIEFWDESEEAPGEYETTMKDVVTPNMPDGGSCFVPYEVASTTTQTGLFLVNTIEGFIDLNIPVYILIDGVIEPLLSTNGDPVYVFAYRYNIGALELITAFGLINIPAGATLVFKPNPYFNSGYFGDSDFLQDKFARFSYRYKFDDGQYSILAPFSQIAFIPKQDGYFQYNNPPTYPTPDLLIKDDQESAYRTTEVTFMENKINKISLRIPLPVGKNIIQNSLKITEIDILYKEAESLAIQVIESINIADVVSQVEGGNDIFVYDYEAQKPYKTLPENELTRTYDKVPVRAFSQEIISNRVVYGNFQDKHTPLPSNVTLNYNVAIDEKRIFNTTSNFTSIIEYPNHNVKQNRSYQVGVILSDRFGRQSSVLLSPSDASKIVNGQTFYGSTVYLPYSPTDLSTASFPGNSIKVLFNDPIPFDPSGTYPGVYNGNPASDNYNPLGWYSYKIVVKQTEQDYYNVYLPGVLAGYPAGSNLEYGSTSHAVLINDNINKVPRDLSEVGPTQKQFRSSVQLNGRVINTKDSVYKNAQFYPEKGKTMVVSTISTALDLFYGSNTDITTVVNPPPGFTNFYNYEGNPLIARISTPSKYGEKTGAPGVIQLSVAETDPTISLLDIYWETSTSGTVEDLNNAIMADTGGIVRLTTPAYIDFTEEITANGSEIFTTPLRLYTDNTGFIENDPVGYISDFAFTATNTESTPQNVTNYFTLIGDSDPTSLLPEWNLKVTNDFFDNIFYMNDATKRNFKFTFTVKVNGINLSFTKYVNLINVNPRITAVQPATLYPTTITQLIHSVPGVNGAGNDSLKHLDLNWVVSSQTRVGFPDTQVNFFSVNSYAGDDFPTGLAWIGDLINNYPGSIPPAKYNVTMRLSDPAAAASISYVVDFTVTPDNVTEYTVIDTANSITYKYLVIQITSQYGTTWYYPFTSSWAALSSLGTVIYIPSLEYSCASGWPAQAPTSTAASLAARGCLGISPSLTGTTTTIDTTGYTFAFN